LALILFLRSTGPDLVVEGNEVRERQSTIKDDDEGPGGIKVRVMRVLRGLQSLHGSDHDVGKEKPQVLEAEPVLLEAVPVTQQLHQAKHTCMSYEEEDTPVTQKLDQAKGARELSSAGLVVLGQPH
jgi:hypothetical protein